MTRKPKITAKQTLAKATPPRRSRLGQLAAKAMQPTVVERPTVDPKLESLGAMERAGETLRYTTLRAEHWLSPQGTLREYLRLNLRLALYLAIPAVILTPILTLLLTTAVTWSAILVEIARNLALVPAWLGTGLLIVAIVGFLRRLVFGR